MPCGTAGANSRTRHTSLPFSPAAVTSVTREPGGTSINTDPAPVPGEDQLTEGRLSSAMVTAASDGRPCHLINPGSCLLGWYDKRNVTSSAEAASITAQLQPEVHSRPPGRFANPPICVVDRTSWHTPCGAALLSHKVHSPVAPAHRPLLAIRGCPTGRGSMSSPGRQAVTRVATMIQRALRAKVMLLTSRRRRVVRPLVTPRMTL